MTSYVLRDLIDASLDGEWGKGEPARDHEPMACIRGTDFAAVRMGDLSSVPIRHIELRKAERKRLRPWDLLIEVAGGTKDQITGRTVLLRPSIFDRADIQMTCASFSRFVRLRRDLCEPAFVFWYLQSLYASGAMHAYHTQHTGVARFQWTTFADRETIHLPLLHTQRRIAGILSTYDDLIENCERRIRVLDEMAQALYREWFVNFRYPGHEKVPLVDSSLGRIPRGWRTRQLTDVARLTMGQSPKSEFYNDKGEGLPFHQGVSDFGVRFPTDRVFCTADARIAEEGDILFSVRAPVGRMNIATKRIALGRGLSAIRHLAGRQAVLWEQLRATFTREDMIGNGAIFAAVTKKEMESIELLDLPDAQAGALTEKLESLHAGITFADSSAINLRKTRDLLLPRLLSGQLSVDVESAA